MRGNGRAAVFGVVVRMSVGTIPNHEWRPAFDLQGYMSRCPLLYVLYWLRTRPCKSFKCSLRSIEKWRPVIRVFGVCIDVIPCEEQLHHCFVPISRCPEQRRPASRVLGI